MVDFADLFPDAAIYDALGDTVTYNGLTIKGIFETNVARIGDDGYTVTREFELEVLLSDLPALPAQGDDVVYKSVAYKVAQIEEISTFRATVSLRKV